MESLIFVPSKKGLKKAKEKRLEKWAELDSIKFTREEMMERIKLDVEVFNSMSILRERAMKCIEMSNKQELMEG